MYRSPSKSQDGFERFSEKLELNLDSLVQNNPFLVVLTDDCNAKSKNWYKNDKCSFEGNITENVTWQLGLQQVIKEPMHILDNSSSCIDLIFTSQANSLIESGVHPSLHSSCHHQIFCSKFDLQIFYPPPYLREVCHHKDAKTGLISLSDILLQHVTGKKLFQTLVLMKR